MDVGDWVTAAGVVVAIAAAAIAWVQARRAGQSLRYAREQAEAAKVQAHYARMSAEAASTQTTAAVDSARSARESVELARREQLRADQPRFELDDDVHENGRLPVVARMVAGPPEVAVEGIWEASSTGPGENGARRTSRRRGVIDSRNIVLGDYFVVRVHIPDWADEAAIRLDLDCADVDDQSRGWSAPVVHDWRVAPEPRVW